MRVAGLGAFDIERAGERVAGFAARGRSLSSWPPESSVFVLTDIAGIDAEQDGILVAEGAVVGLGDDLVGLGASDCNGVAAMAASKARYRVCLLRKVMEDMSHVRVGASRGFHVLTAVFLN